MWGGGGSLLFICLLCFILYIICKRGAKIPNNISNLISYPKLSCLTNIASGFVFSTEKTMAICSLAVFVN